MGIDFELIVMSIEERFRITLRNDDVGTIIHEGDVSAGDLHRLICQKIAQVEVVRGDLPLNNELLEHLREAIHEVTQLDIENIQPGTSLTELFPVKSRRQQWEELREATALDLPRLEYPWVVRLTSLLLAVTMVVAEVVPLFQIWWMRFIQPVVAVLALWVFGESFAKVLSLFSRFRTRFPVRVDTVKELCRWARDHYPWERFTERELVPERREEVWRELVAIITNELDVNATLITPQSLLRRDLGMS